MAPWLPEFDPTDTAAGREFLERLTTNAALLQRELLTEVLKRNAHTEYLRPFLLLPDGPDGDLREAFKKRVPVSCYDDIRPYVRRIATGGEPPSSLLCSDSITHLLKSSGTSGGQHKIFPSAAEELDRKLYFHGVQALVRKLHLHADQVEVEQEGLGMRLSFTFPVSTTASGLTVQAATGAYYHSRQFQEQDLGGFDRCTSPIEAILCPDVEQSMYCQLLCGLLQRDDVDHVGAFFANTLVRAVKFLEHNWEEMCSDIRTGSLSGRITHAPMRHAVLQRLRRPDPALAEEVASQCADRPWDGIVARLWPQARYQLDDLLTVSGFYNATPLFHFSGRHDVILGIDDEKISEGELLGAISQATELHLIPLGYMLSGSTSFADISDFPGHYIMFWEMTSTRSNNVAGDIPDQTVMENCCSAIEQCFNQSYCEIRKSGDIGALEIRVLKQGAFDSLVDFFVSRGTSASQYKTPTVIHSKEAMMVLEERVAGRFFSKQIPGGSMSDDYVEK